MAADLSPLQAITHLGSALHARATGGDVVLDPRLWVGGQVQVIPAQRTTCSTTVVHGVVAVGAQAQQKIMRLRTSQAGIRFGAPLSQSAPVYSPV